MLPKNLVYKTALHVTIAVKWLVFSYHLILITKNFQSFSLPLDHWSNDVFTNDQVLHKAEKISEMLISSGTFKDIYITPKLFYSAFKYHLNFNSVWNTPVINFFKNLRSSSISWTVYCEPYFTRKSKNDRPPYEFW